MRLQTVTLPPSCSLELADGPWQIMTSHQGNFQENPEDEYPVQTEHPLILENSNVIVEKRDELSPQNDAGAARKLLTVMAGFLICWLPYFIWLPTSTILEIETPRPLYTIILWIGYTNSTLNPLLYVLHLQVHSKGKILDINCICILRISREIFYVIS